MLRNSKGIIFPFLLYIINLLPTTSGGDDYMDRHPKNPFWDADAQDQPSSNPYWDDAPPKRMSNSFLKSSAEAVNLTESSEEIYPQPRIAGGRAIHPGDVPYHLQLRHLDRYQCGATLIISEHGNQVVITGAQCVTYPRSSDSSTELIPTDQLSVIGGRIKRDGVHFFEQFRAVTKVSRFPRWHHTYSFDVDDVAVLHIVQPLPLINRERTKPTGAIVISGWGQTSFQDPNLAQTLHVGVIEAVPMSDCRRAYNGAVTAQIEDSQFCAGKIENPTYQGACMGDYGGPAANVFNNTLYLVGVFSYLHPKCGNRYQPNIFTDLSYYISWIQQEATPVVRGRSLDFGVEEDFGPDVDSYHWQNGGNQLLRKPRTFRPRRLVSRRRKNPLLGWSSSSSSLARQRQGKWKRNHE